MDNIDYRLERKIIDRMGNGIQGAAMAIYGDVFRSGAKVMARVKGVARGGHLTTFSIP